MQPSLDPYPLAQAILQRYVLAPGVIPRADFAGKMVQTARLGADRMPILATVLHRWRTGVAGWAYTPSGLPHLRPPDRHQMSASTVVQGRRVRPEPQDPVRAVSTPQPHRMVATATHSGSRPQAAAGAAPKKASKGTIGGHLSASRSGSTSAQPAAHGSEAGDQPTSKVKKTEGIRPAAAKLRPKTEPLMDDLERPSRSQAPRAAVSRTGAPLIGAKILPAADTGDADIRLIRPLKRSAVPKQPGVFSKHRSDTPDASDRTLKGRSGRSSAGRTSEGADHAVLKQSVRQTPLDPAATGPAGAGKKPDHPDVPARIQPRHRSEATAYTIAKFPDDIQPRHPTVQRRADADAQKVHQVAGSRRGTPAETAPDGLRTVAAQSPITSPVVNKLPTLQHKNRNIATGAQSVPQIQQARPAHAFEQAKPTDTAGGPGKTIGSAASTTNNIPNWGQRKSGPRQPTAVSNDLPNARQNLIGRKIERYLDTPVIARSRHIASGATESKAVDTRAKTTGPDIHPVTRRIFHAAQLMPLNPSSAGLQSIEQAGRPNGSGKDAGPEALYVAARRQSSGPDRVQRSHGDRGAASTVVPTTGATPAPIRSSLALQPGRTAKSDPTAIQPDSGFAPTPARMSLMKPAAPVGRLSLKQTRELVPIGGQRPIGKLPQSTGLADQQPMPMQPLTARAQPLLSTYPSVFIARAPVTRQPQMHRPWESAPGLALTVSRNIGSHPLAKVQPVHRIYPQINLHPAATSSSDLPQWPAAGRSAEVQAVFRTPANRALNDSSTAAGNANGTSTEALESQSPETNSGSDSVDLERLADEIYAILERRLTIERESLGQ